MNSSLRKAAFGVPTGVKVARLLFGSHEAAVDIGAGATCKLQQAERFEHPGQQLPPPGRVAESVNHVLPPGGVFPARKVASDRIKIGQTTLMYLAVDHADAPTALAAAKKKGEWKRTTLLDR